MTQAKVLASLTQGGITFSHVQNPSHDPSNPLSNSFKERFIFALPSVAPKDGLVVVKLHSGITPDQADPIRKAIDAINEYLS